MVVLLEDNDGSVRARIAKDLALFSESIGSIDTSRLKGSSKVLDLARMYASDSRSFMEKGDLYTSFSAIAYAHGLLDAIKLVLEDA